MLNNSNFKDLITYTLIIGLFLLVFFILKPIIFAMIYGILLAYIFYPLYNFINKKIKSEFLSALIVCLGLIVIIFVLAVVIFDSLSKQIIDLYLFFQQVDVVKVTEDLMPEFLRSTAISGTIIESINANLSILIGNYVSGIGGYISHAPIILIKLFVIIFVFFFCLKDGHKSIEYIRELSPFKKETNDRFFENFKKVTNSILIGQIVVGVVQGVVAGLGYFIFGVNNVLILTALTVIAAIIPMVGPWLVWIPVDIYLFASGNSGAALGLLIYGTILVGWVDNFIRPIIVSRRTKINSLIIMVGMIGGLLSFGFIGIIMGPLILSYALLVMELYLKKNIGDESVFIKEVSPNKV